MFEAILIYCQHLTNTTQIKQCYHWMNVCAVQCMMNQPKYTFDEAADNCAESLPFFEGNSSPLPTYVPPQEVCSNAVP